MLWPWRSNIIRKWNHFSGNFEHRREFHLSWTQYLWSWVEAGAWLRWRSSLSGEARFAHPSLECCRHLVPISASKWHNSVRPQATSAPYCRLGDFRDSHPAKRPKNRPGIGITLPAHSCKSARLSLENSAISKSIFSLTRRLPMDSKQINDMSASEIALLWFFPLSIGNCYRVGIF